MFSQTGTSHMAADRSPILNSRTMNIAGDEIDPKYRNLYIKTLNRHRGTNIKVETKSKPKWIKDMTPNKSSKLNQLNDKKMIMVSTKHNPMIIADLGTAGPKSPVESNINRPKGLGKDRLKGLGR